MPRLVLILLACAWLSAACPARGSGDHPPLKGDAYPGLVRAPSTIDFDFMWRQRVTASWGEGRSRGFDAVLQKRGDTLELIGLTPMGTPAFVIRQRGADELTFDNRTSEDLPFPPRFIVLDVQRVFFPWLPPGQGEGAVGDELVHEERSGGRLVERSFRRQDGEPPGVVTVRYRGWEDGADAPREAVLDNGWFGYRLTVETLDQQRLARVPGP